jgi:hypothetical protein
MEAYLDGASRLFLDFPDDDFDVTGRGDNRRRPDPTPEEIAAMCAEIRATWSDDEARVRMGFSEIRRTRLNN